MILRALPIKRWCARSLPVHGLVLGLLLTPVLLAFALSSKDLQDFVGHGWSMLLQLLGWFVFVPLSFQYLCVILILFGWRFGVALQAAHPWPLHLRQWLHRAAALLLLGFSALLITSPWLPAAPKQKDQSFMQFLGCMAAMHGCGGARDPFAWHRIGWAAAGVGCSLFGLAFLFGGLKSNEQSVKR